MENKIRESEIHKRERELIMVKSGAGKRHLGQETTEYVQTGESYRILEILEGEKHMFEQPVLSNNIEKLHNLRIMVERGKVVEDENQLVFAKEELNTEKELERRIDAIEKNVNSLTKAKYGRLRRGLENLGEMLE